MTKKKQEEMIEEVSEETISKQDPKQQVEGNDEVASQIQALQEEVEKQKDSYLRLHADFDNFRKRVIKEKAELSTNAVSGVMTKLINVLDNFDRAIASSADETSPFYEGVKMVSKQLNDILVEEGLTKIQAIGQVFDPNLHYAVMTDTSEEVGDDVILDELQAGYQFKEKVIRPSMVKVNKL